MIIYSYLCFLYDQKMMFLVFYLYFMPKDIVTQYALPIIFLINISTFLCIFNIYILV